MKSKMLKMLKVGEPMKLKEESSGGPIKSQEESVVNRSQSESSSGMGMNKRSASFRGEKSKQDEDDIRKAGADGTVLVAGVSGFYVCDGGCDKATVGTAYAQNLQAQGVKINKYDNPKPAKLCDGTVQNVITGYLVADVELLTRAGPIILPETHIDILEGPEQNTKQFALYRSGRREAAEIAHLCRATGRRGQKERQEFRHEGRCRAE